MRAKLFCKFGSMKGASFEIGEEATIGRNEDNAIVLAHPSISQHHARIFFDSELNCYLIEDLGSSNGTRLDDHGVNDPERLGRLHVLTFANSLDFMFQQLAEPSARESAPPKKKSDRVDLRQTSPEKSVIGLPPGLANPGEPSGRSLAGELEVDSIRADDSRGTRIESGGILLPPALLKKQKKRPGMSPRAEEKAKSSPAVASLKEQFFLRVHIPPEPPLWFELREGENIVGRTEEVQIQIPNGEISRRHAVFQLKNGKVTVKDLGSLNKTFLDRRVVRKEREVLAGKEIFFGKIEARLIRKTEASD